MIDSHHHLWNYDATEFSWLEPDLHQSYLHPDLSELLNANGITAAIAVQARCHLDENLFLTEQAQHCPHIQGIVGWADLTAPNISETLDQLSREPLVKGLREITQGTPDAQFLDNPDFDRGAAQLEKYGLSYDLLIFEDQLEVADAFVSRHPNIPIILDHAAKPGIRHDAFPDDWAKGIRQLARHPYLSCKISGLATEIRDNSPCSPSLLKPYFETLLEAFGPSRLLFGSDWPVSLSGTSYQEWISTVKALTKNLTPEEQHLITHANASRIYQL